MKLDEFLMAVITLAPLTPNPSSQFARANTPDTEYSILCIYGFHNPGVEKDTVPKLLISDLYKVRYITSQKTF